MNIANATVDAIGGLERIRNTPLPASHDVFVRMLSWVFGFQLLLNFKANGASLVDNITGVVLFLGFLMTDGLAPTLKVHLMEMEAHLHSPSMQSASRSARTYWGMKQIHVSTISPKTLFAGHKIVTAEIKSH